MNRRELITGLISLVAAPAIVRVGSLMPVKVMLPEMSGTEIARRYLNNWHIERMWYNHFGEIIFENIDIRDFYER